MTSEIKISIKIFNDNSVLVDALDSQGSRSTLHVTRDPVEDVSQEIDEVLGAVCGAVVDAMLEDQR